MGALAGFIIFYLTSGNQVIQAVLFAVLTLLGFIVSGKVEAELKEKDPRCIVIDEVVSAYVTMFCIYPERKFFWLLFVLGFFLNRFFDVVKPLGINKLQSLKGSAGIMFDDILAGIYSNVILWMVIWGFSL